MQKLDATLVRQLGDYKASLSDAGQAAAPPKAVRVLARIKGDLPSIIAQGFKLLSTYGPIVTGTVKLADLEKIAAMDNVVHIEAEKFHSLQLNVSVPEIHANQVWTASPGYTGAGVIVGIVDTGIDIFHHCFRKADGTTRIRWIWDQTLAPVGAENSPAEIEFAYGVEFTEADINAALLTPDKPFRHADLNGHGTHVAGTAAGNGLQAGGCKSANTYIGVAPGADLVVVKSITPHGLYAIIPSAAPYTVTVNQPASWKFDIAVSFLPNDDTLSMVAAAPAQAQYSAAAGVYSFNAQDAGKPVLINYSSTASISVSNVNYLAGIKYIFERASAAGPGGVNMPAVANISLGSAGGPHDGSAGEEIALFNILTGGNTPPVPIPTSGIPGRVVVCAAGNNGNHGQPGNALHVSGTVAQNSSVSFAIVIPPNITESDYFDLWYTGNGRLSFKLTNPAGTAMPVIPPPASGSTTAAPATLGTDSVTVTTSVNMAQNGKSEIFFTIKPAAATAATNMPTVAAGSWTVTLTETAGNPVTRFDCWTDVSHTSGWAGFAPASPPSPTVTAPDNTGTLTIPATAVTVITVGAYNPADGTIANFSGSGPTADGRQKPEICGPGMGIVAPKTEENEFGACCHCCLDYYVPKEGTSMAAPHVAGVVALMLQKNPAADFVTIRNQIQQHGRASKPATTLPNNDWGFGKIDALQSVTSLPAGTAAPPAAGPVASGDVPAPENPVYPVDEAQSQNAQKTSAQIVPIAANWWAYIPPGQRLRAMAAQLRNHPAGLQMLALVSAHVDEVIRLINNNRRIAVAWHRLPGPELIWEMLRILDDPEQPLFPAETSNGPLRDGFARMLTLLAQYGSPGLRADATNYRKLILALPGQPAGALSRSNEEGDSHAEWRWDARTRRA